MKSARLVIALFWVRVWWHGREWRRLLWGVPFLTTTVLGICLAGTAPPPVERQQEYETRAHEALQSRDWATALLCFESLASADPSNPSYLYGLATSLQELGQTGRSAQLFARLAPRDRLGYGPAHLRQAKRLRTEGLTPDKRALYEYHLNRAIEDQPDRAEPHHLLGEFYLEEGQGELAEIQLVRAAACGSEVCLPLARLYKVSGRLDEARRRAEEAAALYRRRAEADRNDHESRIHWAEALLLLQEFEAGLLVLEAGWQSSHAEVYHHPLAQTYGLCAAAAAQNPLAGPAEVLVLLEGGLKHDADSLGLLVHLVSLASGVGPTAARAQERVQDIQLEDRRSATLYFCLGQEAWRHHLPEEARRYFARALEQDPEATVAANNLAFVLAQGTVADQYRALEVIDEAIRKQPGEPAFRATRGQLLLRQGRWRAAAADLETALPGLSSPAEAHRGLAEAYGHLGLKLLAARHRELADLPPGGAPAPKSAGDKPPDPARPEPFRAVRQRALSAALLLTQVSANPTGLGSSAGFLAIWSFANGVLRAW